MFAPREQIRKQIAAIVTDSRAPGEPKQVEGSALFQIYQAFASSEETEKLRQAYAEGISWGEAKQLLFERIDREIAPMRERHDELIGNPAELERILAAGAAKARALAAPFMAELRQAVGLRNLAAGAGKAAPAKAAKAALPSFKQYREDGHHYFKLVDASGRLLAQSAGFASPQDAGKAVAQLKRDGGAGSVGDLQLAQGVSAADVTGALRQLAQAQDR